VEKLRKEGYSYFKIARMLEISMDEMKIICIKNHIGENELLEGMVKEVIKCRK
jgi:hypothetical protein